MREIIILSIDIETSGCNVIKNGIISIGYCFGDLKGNVLKKGRLSMNLEDNLEFEERCFTQFWSKNLEILTNLQNEAKPIREQLNKFVQMLDDYDKIYDLRIISDNKDFDLGFINYYLAKYLDRNPLHYKLNEEYRSTYDTNSYSRGVLRMTYEDSRITDETIMEKFNFTIDNCVHNHYPDDDAEYIYKFHLNLINKINIK